MRILDSRGTNEQIHTVCRLLITCVAIAREGGEGWGKVEFVLKIYVLLAEVSARTVNYGPSFCHQFMARASNRWKKKTRMRDLQYGPKKTTLIRCLLFGYLFEEPETCTGQTI